MGAFFLVFVVEAVGALHITALNAMKYQKCIT
jgi:hypothetical protein